MRENGEDGTYSKTRTGMTGIKMLVRMRGNEKTRAKTQGLGGISIRHVRMGRRQGELVLGEKFGQEGGTQRHGLR